MSIDYINKILNQINGLEFLRPNDEGILSIRVNDTFQVFISDAQENTYYLYAYISGLPKEIHKLNPILLKILDANLFNKGTGEAWFAIDSSIDKILLIATLDQDEFMPERFIKHLQKFISLIAHWKTEFESNATPADEPIQKDKFLKI